MNAWARGSEPVEVGLAVRADHRQAGLLGEELGRDGAHLLLVDGVQAAFRLDAALSLIGLLIAIGFVGGRAFARPKPATD